MMIGEAVTRTRVSGRLGEDVQSCPQRLVQLLQELLQIGNVPDVAASRQNTCEMGDEEIPETERTPASSTAMADPHCREKAESVRALAASSGKGWTIGAG